MATLISLQNISLGFAGGGEILSGLNLEIDQGEILVVVGSSGVGKSTLLRAIAGLLPLRAGQVTWHQPHQGDHARIGFVFQEPRLLPWRRVRDNVALGLEHRRPGAARLSKAARRARADEALAQVGLADYGERWPYQLSGGQRQRVGIARALVIAPQILLMDEPFSALDAVTRAGLQDELVRLFHTTQMNVVFVTHDLEEASFLGDRIAVLGGSPGGLPGRLLRLVHNPHPRQRPVADESGRIISATARDLATTLQENYDI
ncbi:MAG: ATP-binding cassette domain-containing protein [Candidatus Symbiobacter sp.]|nr:ATP-binding cassette domain-containing protein [Candidatus Symbiobacter sp.]